MSLGIPEISLILFAIVLLFGSKRIPELARAFGRATVEYKKAKEIIQKETSDIKETIENEIKVATQEKEELETTEFQPNDEENKQPV